MQVDFKQITQLIGQPSQLVAFLKQNGGLKNASSTAWGAKARKSYASHYHSKSIRAIQWRSGAEFEALGYSNEPGPDVPICNSFSADSSEIVAFGALTMILCLLMICMGSFCWNFEPGHSKRQRRKS